MPESMKKTVQTLDPPELSVPPTYSHVSAVEGPARLIFTAGQVGADRAGIVPESYEEQIKQALLNLTACLKGFGASPSDIVKLTYYIVNYNPKNRVHAPLLSQYLGSHRPSTTLVPVSALAQPSFLFEIEATAAVQSPSPILTPIKSSSTVPVVDVLVIGAGLSGLQATHDIQQAGLSCLVLEARDRVGGKTWLLPCANGKGVVDVGAAWINDTNQSKMFALAQRFGLETITQRTEGDCLAQGVGKFPYGSVPPFQDSDQENMIKIRDTIEDLCQMIDLHNPKLSNYDSMNLEEFVKHLGGGEVAFQTARVWTKAMLGCEPSEMSALFFLDYCKSGGGLMQTRSDMKNGGQYLRIKKGTQSFSKGLAATLTPGSIHLNTPISQIKQDTQGCTVISKTGAVFHSKKVILSIPTPLYKDITFSPALTGAKLSLTSSTTLGCTSKMILVYEKPWWRTQNLSGMTQSFVGPYTITRDTSNDSEGHYSLTSMPGADAARAWSKLPAHERRAQILAQVAETFGNKEEAYKPIEIFEMEWSKEEFSKGCPCPVMPPNVLTKWGHALREKVGHLHFVGTETAFEWKGYMEGAVRSGERGAEEVVDVLRGDRESKAKL